MNQSQNKRPLFSISIAAELLGTHPRTLMAYEREKLVVPHRTSGQRRLYSYQNLQAVSFIQYLTQQRGVNLAGAQLLLTAIKKAQEHNLDLKKVLFPDYKAPKLA